MVGVLPTETAPAIVPVQIHRRPRLLYIDGLRGFAALFVLLHHIHADLNQHAGLPPIIELATRWFQLGHYPVAVFIVVSGFSLMLPVAMSPDLRIDGSFLHYFLRRARRILPAYYVVLFSLLLLAALWPAFRELGGGTMFRPGAIISHLGLFHNLSPYWCYQIDPPMWSVATEWQIYFLFPTLLLPLFRKFGGTFTIIFGSAVGIAIHRLAGRDLGWVCPWYLGLFAMGMTAAMVFRPARPMPTRRSWAALGVATFLAAVTLINVRPDAIIAVDLVIGCCTASLLAWCALSPRGARRPVVLKALESTLAIRLGDISYSLYLVHFPIIAITGHFLRKALNPTPMQLALLLPVLAVPVSLALAVILQRKVERCFIAKFRCEEPTIPQSRSPSRAFRYG